MIKFFVEVLNAIIATTFDLFRPRYFYRFKEWEFPAVRVAVNFLNTTAWVYKGQPIIVTLPNNKVKVILNVRMTLEEYTNERYQN